MQRKAKPFPDRSGQHPCFWTKVILAGLPRKAFPPKFVNGQPKNYFQIKKIMPKFVCQQSRRSAVKDVFQMMSCSNSCQPIIHSPHHVLETFRLFIVKVTGAAQCDFGLVQLQKGELRYLDSCMFAVCPALRGLSEHAFCPLSHLDCKVKGAAPFSPFSFPNKSSSMLQMVKGWSWHQVAFGAVPLHKGKAVVL